MPSFSRLLGLQDSTPAERRAAMWVAAMFFFAMASTGLLRPLRNQFGVQRGVEYLPFLYTLTLVATVVLVLPFWWLANRMPSRRFIPIVLHVSTASVALLAVGLAFIGEYDWQRVPWLGEWFWGGFSAFNVAIPALVWIHAVEHFRSEAARRVFGLIAIGGTVGVVVGSWLASTMTEAKPRLDAAGQPTGVVDGLALAPWTAAVVSAAMLVSMWLVFRASLPACRALAGGEGRVAQGGVLEGARILVRSRRVQAIAFYMVLLGVLATAFHVAETDWLSELRKRDQHTWLADVEFWGQSFVLGLQLLCTGRLLQRWPGSALLISLPIVSIVGLGALWLVPRLDTLNLVQIGRRGAQYAFEKPAREVLYTPLALATKHKVKFLLDTFAFRLGDLLGVLLQVQMMRWGWTRNPVVLVAIAVALVWIVLGLWLGRRRNVADAA